MMVGPLLEVAPGVGVAKQRKEGREREQTHPSNGHMLFVRSKVALIRYLAAQAVPTAGTMSGQPDQWVFPPYDHQPSHATPPRTIPLTFSMFA